MERHEFLLYSLVILIYIILIFSFSLFSLDILRRLKNRILYKTKDRFRDRFLKILKIFVETKDYSILEKEIFQKAPKTAIGREALMEALMKTANLSQHDLVLISIKSGLRNFYLNRLHSSIAHVRGEAYKALGILGDRSIAVEILYHLSHEQDPEVIFSGILSMIKLISKDEYYQVLDLLTDKYRKGLLNSKAIALITTELMNRYPEDSLSIFISYFSSKNLDPFYKASLLDGIYYSVIENGRLLEFALNLLKDQEAEIIARGLKLAYKSLPSSSQINFKEISPFLFHKEWFVRLNALKLIAKLPLDSSELDYIGVLLTDENYLVRKEASKIIVKFLFDLDENKFEKIMKLPDRYAIESLFDSIIRNYSITKDERYKKYLEKYFACFFKEETRQGANFNYGYN